MGNLDTNIRVEKNEIGPLSHTHTKIISKWTEDLNTRNELINLLEKNHKENISWYWSEQLMILGMSPKVR